MSIDSVRIRSLETTAELCAASYRKDVRSCLVVEISLRWCNLIQCVRVILAKVAGTQIQWPQQWPSDLALADMATSRDEL